MSDIKTVSPLRQRMIEDMAARKLNPHTQRSHISSCKRFAAWLKRSPDPNHMISSGHGLTCAMVDPLLRSVAVVPARGQVRHVKRRRSPFASAVICMAVVPGGLAAPRCTKIHERHALPVTGNGLRVCARRKRRGR